MEGTQSLRDSLLSANLAGMRRDLADVVVPNHFNAQIAGERMARRGVSLGMSPAMIDKAISTGLDAVETAQVWCESPIEKRVLPWLVFEDYGDDVLTIPAPVHHPKTEHYIPEGEVVIVPQFAFAKYRMDFAVVARAKGKLCIVCVELDGKEFHSAEKDKLRDMYLLSWGIPTIRVPGRDTFTTPHTVSEQAAAALIELMRG